MQSNKIIDAKVLPELAGSRLADYRKIKKNLAPEDLNIESFLQTHYSDEVKVLYAIESLLKKTKLSTTQFLIYINLAISSKYSTNFIRKLLVDFQKHNLKVYSIAYNTMLSLVKNGYDVLECIDMLMYFYNEGYDPTIPVVNEEDIFKYIDNEKYQYLNTMYKIMQRNAGKLFTKDVRKVQYVYTDTLRDKIRNNILPALKDNNYNLNAELINKHIGSCIYLDKGGSNLLFYIASSCKENITADEQRQIIIALKTLLNTSFLNPNQINDSHTSFVNVLTNYVSAYVLVDFVKDMLNYGWDFKRFSCDILIDYFESNASISEKNYLFKAFLDLGYDVDNISLKHNKTFAEYINDKILDESNWRSYLNFYNNSVNASHKEHSACSRELISATAELQKYGVVYNNLDYTMNPAIGREREVEETIKGLLKEKSNPILIGKPGVGKTSIAKSIAYLINKGEVPDELKNKAVVGIMTASITSRTEYRGQFERKVEDLIEAVRKYNAILFIDEIHSILGAGTTMDNTRYDLAAMLQQYFDKYQIMMIGTTTRTLYDNDFVSSGKQTGLTRRFFPIMVSEPDNVLLSNILDNILDDYCLRNDITFTSEDDKREIINILVSYTNSRCVLQTDPEYNPSLAVSIIDTAFASSKYRGDHFINIDDFIYGFNVCSRITINARMGALSALNSLKVNKGISRSRANVTDINFRYKKDNK